MASKKSSAVPNNPITGVLAPRASRYFGRNFFHSSSPKPRRNTAPDAMVTFRSRLRKSRSRVALVGGFLFSFGKSKRSRLPGVQRCCGQRVKVTADLVDVCKGKCVRVSAIGEQDVCSSAVGINPATCPGKSGMAESIQRQARTSGRTLCGGQLPGERAGFIQSFGHVF